MCTYGISQGGGNQNKRTEQMFKNRIQENFSKNKIRHESTYLKGLPCTRGNWSRKGNIKTCPTVIRIKKRYLDPPGKNIKSLMVEQSWQASDF